MTDIAAQLLDIGEGIDELKAENESLRTRLEIMSEGDTRITLPSTGGTFAIDVNRRTIVHAWTVDDKTARIADLEEALKGIIAATLSEDNVLRGADVGRAIEAAKHVLNKEESCRPCLDTTSATTISENQNL